MRLEVRWIIALVVTLVIDLCHSDQNAAQTDDLVSGVMVKSNPSSPRTGAVTSIIQYPQGQQDQSHAKNVTYNKELAVIELGKMDYAQRNEKRKPLLCVSFLKAAEDPMIQLKDNMKHMGSACELAAVFYDGTDEQISKFCGERSDMKQSTASAGIDQEYDSLGKSTTVVHCKRAKETIDRPTTSITLADGSVIEQKLSVPKTVLYAELLPLLPYYEEVFLIDEDISLEGFNLDNFMRIWKCVFTADTRPLIVQPLIVENTQYFSFVQVTAWKNFKRKVYAATAGLVEQQVPFFDAVFFEWFVRHVLSHTREIAMKQGVDQSHDRTWCKAAQMYGTAVLHRNYTGDHGNNACAVIVGGYAFTAVHHLNTRSLENKRANRAAYREKAQAVLARYEELYPTWVAADIRRAINPLDRRASKKFKRYSNFGTYCPG